MLEGQDDDEDIPGISEPDIEVLAPENNKVENEIGKFFLRNLRILEFGVFELNYEKFKMININLKVEILKSVLFVFTVCKK